MLSVLSNPMEIKSCLDMKNYYQDSHCCDSQTAPLETSFIPYQQGYANFDAWKNAGAQYEPPEYKLESMIGDVKNAASENERRHAIDKLSIVLGSWRALMRDPTETELQDQLSKLNDGTHANTFEMYTRLYQTDEAKTLRSAGSSDAFEGKVVVITGGSSGMGFSSAVYAAQSGAKAVYCMARSKGYFDWHIESARKGTTDSDRYPWYTGPIDVEDTHLEKIYWKTGDIRLLEDTEIDGKMLKGQKTLFAEIEEESGKIDVLWVNAQAFPPRTSNLPKMPLWPYFITDPNKLARHRIDPTYPECQFMTGALGSAYTMQAAQPHLKNTSHVVLTSSGWRYVSLDARTGEQSYAMSKAIMSRTLLAYDDKSFSAKVSVISPDFVLTDMPFPYDRPVPFVDGTIPEMRETFLQANITRQVGLDLVQNLGSGFNPHLDMLENGFPFQDLNLNAAGLSKNFYSSSISVAYLLARIVQDSAPTPTEYQLVNPNAQTIVGSYLGLPSMLSKQQLDPSLLNVLTGTAAGNPNTLYATDLDKLLASQFSTYRKVVA